MNEKPFQLKRLFLYLLIVSVFFSAVLGIAAILAGESFGWAQIRILATTTVLSGASICGLACGALWERRRERPLAAVGIGLATVSAVMLIAGIWTEVNSEGYWKTAFSLMVLAIAAAHLSLLAMARLQVGFIWARIGAYVSIGGLALLIDAMILGERPNEAMFRVVGVAGILVAAFSVLIPILHRLGRMAIGAGRSHTHAAVASPGQESLENELLRLRARVQELEARNV